MKKHTLRLTLAAASALSVSIASQLQAAPFVSNGADAPIPPDGGGMWEDPASWLGGVGFPNTFVGDSATITAGDVIVYDDFDLDGDGGVTTPATPFTTLMGVVPGGLSVANGNSITIDTGGILTQATLSHEIRIGEGAGGVNGIGIMTIDTGGIFSSGTAVGVAVGSDLNYTGLGNGTVNLNDGQFIMGTFLGAGAIPAGPAALGVGIEGSTGVFNVGDGLGGAGTATLDLEGNGNDLGVGTTNQIGSPAGTGTVIVNADGLLSFSGGDLVFGEVGGTGTLTLNGGTVGNGAIATGEIRIGSSDGTTGGTGILNINSGTINTAGQLNIGRGLGANGTGTLTTGTLITGPTRVGRDGGTGDLNVLGGAMNTTFLGIADNGSGTMDITGGTVAIGNAGQSFVGNGSGMGTLNIAGPGVVNNTGTQDLQIGFNGGTGNVNVTNGGKLNHNWWLNVARGGTSTGNVLVDGAGSEILLDGGGDINWNVGEDGMGTMTVSNGGKVDHDNAASYRSHVGRNSGSQGELNVTTGGLVEVTELFIGTNGGATGEVNILSGGVVTVQAWQEIGSRGANGTLNVDGAGSRYSMLSTIDYDGAGTAWPRNGGGGGDMQVGYNGGTGNINVTNGGRLETGWWLNVARVDAGQPRSTGFVNVDGAGSVLAVGNTVGLGGRDARTNIGEHGDGTMNITNGGAFIGNSETAVGQNSGGIGELNVNTGGSFTTGNWIIIGNQAGSTGTVNLDDDGSSITLTGEYDAGGNLQERSRLMIANNGTGTLNQTGGTITFSGWSAIGLSRESVGTYNMSGGTMTNRQMEFDFDWFVGRQNSDPNVAGSLPARGFLNISGTANFDMATDVTNGDPGGRNGMRLNVGSGHDFGTNNSQGTVNISGGTLSVLSFTVGDNGQGTVNQDGGTVNVGQWLEIGQGNAADGPQNVASYTLNDGVLNTQQVVVGTRRAGLMTVNGGVINLGTNGTTANPGWGDFAVGRDGDGANHGNGHLIVNGGTINGNGKHFQIARGGPNTQGLVDMTGGDINGLSLMTIGDGGATNAVVNMSGGTITTNNEVRVGQARNTVGALNVSGTAVLTSGGEFQVGNDGGTGTATITGGTVTALSYVAIGRSIGAFQITNYATADAVIDGGAELAYSFPANYTTSNTQDNGDGGGPFGLGVQVQGLPGGDNNDFAFVGMATFTVGTTGSYIFGNNTDDGSRLRLSINGGLFTQIITDDVLSGPHTVSSAPVALTLGDTITLDWMWFERGGGAEGESFYSSDGGVTNALWEDPSQGLTLATGMYTGTVYKSVAFGSTGTVNLSGTGVLQKTGGGGSFDIGSWNGGGGSTTPVTGTLDQSGGSVINTVSDTHIGRDSGVIGLWDMSGGTATIARLNVGNGGTGTLTMTGGTIDASSVYVGVNGGSTGAANLDGGVLTTQFIEAGGGTASLSFDGGTVQALADEGNFIRNFDNSGPHSAINIEDGDATIDDGGFIVRILGTNVIANPGDTAIDGLAGTVLNKDGDGTLTIEGVAGDGNLAVHALDGDLDFESSQTLDALVIDATATVTLSAPSTPPAPAELVAGDLAGDDSGVVAEAGGVQAVPEPGTLGLLTVGLFGLLTRRIRGKRN